MTLKIEEKGRGIYAQTAKSFLLTRQPLAIMPLSNNGSKFQERLIENLSTGHDAIMIAPIGSTLPVHLRETLPELPLESVPAAGRD
jgi:hypothetical protein